MDLFNLEATLTLDTDKFEAGLSRAKGLATTIGKGIGTAMKIGGAALAATTAAVTALGTSAVKAYASFEQLAGGVEKLYGPAADKLMQYAENAYKTAGMSANQYMETATSFSAALVNALGGDFDKAADMTDVAMKAMSDNVNTFGSTMESVENAFKGFSKQNYTMLDNLKLGYGGTKEEMERLLRDAEKYGGLVEGSFKIENFADIIQAIQLVQEHLNVAGTTQKEAMTTIEGSAAATKAAWQNVITAIGRGEGLDKALDGLLSSLFGEKEGEGLLNQIIPRIETVMNSIGVFIEKAGPIISEKIPPLINSILPTLLKSAMTLLGALAKGFIDNLPMFLQVAFDLIKTLAAGLIKALPTLIPSIVKVIVDIATMLTNPDNLAIIIEAALEIITQLAWGLVNSIPVLIDGVFQVVSGIVEYLVNPANLTKIVGAAFELIMALATGLINAIPTLVAHIPTIILAIFNGLVDGVVNTDWLQIGMDLIGGIAEGMWNALTGLLDTIMDIGTRIVDKVKDIFGIHSPSKLFENEIGKNLGLGLAKGIEESTKDVEDAMDEMIDATTGDISNDINLSSSGSGSSIRHSGTIRLEGVNNEDEFVAVSEYVLEDMITRILSRQARLA